MLCSLIYVYKHSFLLPSHRISPQSTFIFPKIKFTLSLHDRLPCYTICMKTEKQETRKLNKKMLERLIIIHNAIKSGIYPNNKILRTLYKETINCSKEPGEATIARDIDCLRVKFHAPLEFDYARNGYYYMDDNWEFALNNISAEDMFYLSSAKKLLSTFNGSPLYKEISNVIDFVTDTQVHNQSEILQRIAVPPTPKVVIDEAIWKIVLQSIKENKVIEFDYNGRWNTNTTHRRVYPYQILLDEGMYFLFGYAEERDAERIFCLTRMKNLKLTEKTFTLPENYDFTKRCGGGKFGSFMTDGIEEFEIEFYCDARQYVRDCIWADDQKITEHDKDDTTTIKFSSSQSLKIRKWVLAQGMNAKPLKPEWFVEDWKEQIRGMIKNANL